MTKELEARIAKLEEAAMSGDPHFYHRASLAEVPNPAKLTDAKIKEISADDGTDTAENSANRDVANQLKEQRATAKTPAKK